MTKKIIILGATGSIGESAIDVVLSHPDEFKVVALAARSSREKCQAYAEKLGAKAYLGEDSAIRAVEEPRLSEVLELYYIDGLTWEDVANRMGLDLRWVYRLHGRALMCVKVPEGMEGSK